MKQRHCRSECVALTSELRTVRLAQVLFRDHKAHSPFPASTGVNRSHVQPPGSSSLPFLLLTSMFPFECMRMYRLWISDLMQREQENRALVLLQPPYEFHSARSKTSVICFGKLLVAMACRSLISQRNSRSSKRMRSSMTRKQSRRSQHQRRGIAPKSSPREVHPCPCGHCHPCSRSSSCLDATRNTANHDLHC